MKHALKLAIGSGLVVPLVLTAVVHAVDSTTSNQTTTTDTKRTQTTQTTDKSSAALRERLEKRKAEFKTRLTSTDEIRLKGKCAASQAVVKGVQQRLTNAAANHTKAYEKISGHLDILQTNLTAASIDTTQLAQQRTALQAKIDAYKLDLQVYQQTLTDLSVMDCTSDPTAFKASLEAARTTREKLSKAAADIRNYINQTLKPTLAALRTQLAQQQSGNTEGAN